MQGHAIMWFQEYLTTNAIKLRKLFRSTICIYLNDGEIARRESNGWYLLRKEGLQTMYSYFMIIYI